MNDITIRKTTLADVDALLHISKTTFFDAFETLNNPEDFKLYTEAAFTKELLALELNDPNSEFYFAVDKDVVIGYIKLNFNEAQAEFQEADGVEIARIYVSQQHQGKQVGLTFINFVVDLARQRKLKYIWLGAWERNPNALRFYKRHGFVEFGSHYFMVGNDRQTDILLKRTIA